MTTVSLYDLPPHFMAVAQDDDDALRLLLEGTPAAGLADHHGYTLVELASLLGSIRCLALLQERPEPPLKVLRRGRHTLEKLDSASFLSAMGVWHCPTLRFSSYRTLQLVISSCPALARRGWVESGEVPPSQRHTNHTVVWLGKAVGYGLMTNRDLPAGAVVGEYTGLVRTAPWSCPAVNPYCVEYPLRWASSHRFVIDARFWGGLLRYVNHSDTPNLVGRWHCDRGLMHLYFVTGRALRRGEQLTVDYGGAYWRRRPPPSDV